MKEEIVNKLEIINLMLKNCEERMEMHGLTITEHNHTIYGIINSILDMMPPGEDADTVTEERYEYLIISATDINLFNDEYERYYDWTADGELIVTSHNGELTYTQRLRKLS